MDRQQRTEELLIKVIHMMADEFGKNAILHGDVILRLLDSPKTISGLDYLFVPYKSTKDIKEPILNVLSKIEDAEFESSSNSKSLKCGVRQKDLVIWVQVNINMVCKNDKLSTNSFAKLYNQNPKTIYVQSYDAILSNKLTTWYEGRLLKDLYDIYVLLNMGVKPDLQILEKSLANPSFFPRSQAPKGPLSISEFYDFLKSETNDLSFSAVSDEMRDLIPKMELLGLNMKIKKAVFDNLNIK